MGNFNNVNNSLTFVTKVGGSDEEISDELLQIIDIVVNCCLINATAIFGIVGNVINIVVLSRHDITTDTTNVILISLSVANLLYDISIPIRRAKCLVSRFDPALAVTTETYMTSYVHPFTRCLVTTDKILVSLMSMERFIAVWFPFSVSRIVTPRRIKATVLGVYIFNVLALTPLFFFFRDDWGYSPRFNSTVAKLKFSDVYIENYDIVNFVFYIILNGTVFGLPWLSVFICTTGIIYKMVKTANARKKIANTASVDPGYDVRALKMLVVICFVCFITYAPASIVDAYSVFAPNFVYMSRVYTVLIYLKDLIYTVNASINFLIYVTMSNKFSSTYKSLFFSEGE